MRGARRTRAGLVDRGAPVELVEGRVAPCAHLVRGHAHGPVLHVFGVQQAHDHPGRRELGAAFERDHGIPVLLLVLHVARRRKRYGVGQQQDCVHVLPHRHGEHTGVHHSELAALTSIFAETTTGVPCEGDVNPLWIRSCTSCG